MENFKSKKPTYLIISSKKGFSLVEILITIVITSIILAALSSLHIQSDLAFRQTKKFADVKEITKLSLAQMEWLFQRWGTSTPCNDPTGNNLCTPIRDCKVANQFLYPPPSSLCLTRNEGAPCDEIFFYANLYGNGFVDRLTSATTVAMMSCRLSQASGENCYHLKRGGPFRRDTNDNSNVLIFSISGLSSNSLDCINIASGQNSNGTMNRQVMAINGFELDTNNQPTQILNLEGGDLLMRVPHRVRLFCQNNPNDNNKRYLYMQAFDMSNDCNNDETPEPLVPVNSFKIQQEGQGIRVKITVRSQDDGTMTVERFFGR